MQKRILSCLGIAAFLFVMSMEITGCSTDTISPMTPLKTDELSASISGLGSFDAINAVADSNSVYVVRASIDNDSLVITMTITKQTTVPYTIDVATDDNSNISYAVEQDGTGKTYSASKINGGSGQIRITSISPRLEGTFSGHLVLLGGSESIDISNGGFNASYQ